MDMKEEAKQILDRLKEEYQDYEEALELINQSYDEILSYPPERALRLAMSAESTLKTFY